MGEDPFRDDQEEQRRTNRKVLILTAIVMLLAAAFGIGLARYGSELPIIGPLFGESGTTQMGEADVRETRILENLAATR